MNSCSFTATCHLSASETSAVVSFITVKANLRERKKKKKDDSSFSEYCSEFIAHSLQHSQVQVFTAGQDWSTAL